MSGWSTPVASAYENSPRTENFPPPDRDTARAAAVELRSRGLTPRDIAAALRLSEAVVSQMLGEPRTTQEIR